MQTQHTFIDLFSGIGGFRLGMTKNNFKCVFSSEIDKNACESYLLNFGENPYCDITKQDEKDIPDFDVLCAGFPCQSFSKAGKGKGFEDETRGTLFFHILRILKHKKPKAFILENVPNLEIHNDGHTFDIIKSSLVDLGYQVSHKVLDASDFGVPQSRKRIIIVGTMNRPFDFSKLKKTEIYSTLPFLDDFQIKVDFSKNNTIQKSFLDKSLYTIIDNSIRQKSKLHFIGYLNGKNIRKDQSSHKLDKTSTHRQYNRIYDASGVMPTILSSESSGRYLVHYQGNVRKLSIDECYRFMGFPITFKKNGSVGDMYRRVGNSVCVNMVEEIAKELKTYLN